MPTPADSGSQRPKWDGRSFLNQFRDKGSGLADESHDTLADETEEPTAEAPSKSSAEMDALRAENEELRALVAQLQEEFDRMIEEKSEVIRNLHVQLHEVEKQGQGQSRGGGGGPNDNDLLALSDELERDRSQMEQDRRQLEDERRQLREDEDAMTVQMREMERQMAKERAELARQRNELQRLHSEIRHELEVAQRDAGLNERLRSLQRRFGEGRGSGPDAGAEEAPPAKPQKGVPPSKKKDSGIFGRFFGKK